MISKIARKMVEKVLNGQGGHYSFNTLYTGSLLQIVQPEVSEAYQ